MASSYADIVYVQMTKNYEAGMNSTAVNLEVGYAKLIA